jgi:UDP-N-acetylmuramate dehydrogenase
MFFAPQSVSELREELAWLRAEDIPLRAQAGYPLDALEKSCCILGLSGIEPLAGIPGTVGGAIVMNAGGRYGCIGSLAKEVRIVTLEGEERVYSTPGKRFSYRRGDFDSGIVTEVVLNLTPSCPALVRKEMRRILREKQVTQPLSARSAGCVFRNPPGDSAGRLIDASGLKSQTRGGMKISPVHANFIVNSSYGNYRQFAELAELARSRVKKEFGIELEYEVTVF